MEIVLIGLAVLVLIPGIWLIIIYNRFAAMRQFVKDSWANIDVELKRRYDLIPNLVNTVKGYASHERETLERVIELRNKARASNGSAASQAADETHLLRGVKQLLAVAEAYPQIKADRNFLDLQEELANTEDRIAAARRFFNANVRDMNNLCQQFPTNLVGMIFGFKPGTFFELAGDVERVVPHVDLTRR
jgi:LemA protein